MANSSSKTKKSEFNLGLQLVVIQKFFFDVSVENFGETYELYLR